MTRRWRSPASRWLGTWNGACGPRHARGASNPLLGVLPGSDFVLFDIEGHLILNGIALRPSCLVYVLDGCTIIPKR